ncbi:MAG TPA: hypothetical protein VFS72_07460 [Agromyces sp.]|nr:hypothetical protein [Agromyces sp.]
MTPRSQGAIATVAVAAGLLLAAAAHQVIATELHRQAWPAWTAADTRHDDAVAAHGEAVALGESLVGRTEALQAVLTADLVRDEDRAELAEALDGLRSAIEADDGGAPLGIVDLTDPGEFAPSWDRYADLWEISELAPERLGAAARVESATVTVQEARAEVDAAAEAVAAAAEEIARAELAAHPAATFRSRQALEGLLDGTAGGASATGADGFTALATAVAEVRASHEAEVARAAQFPVRAEIEAFARSIANGVELDFAWAFEVAGMTSDVWYAGTAEFEIDGPEWGLITLTESIERGWGLDPNAEAVVVHEVGHTQVVRDSCRVLFDGFGGDHETWATAWAISMGYDLPGAGIEAYGRPSEAQVAAAAGCR